MDFRAADRCPLARRAKVKARQKTIKGERGCSRLSSSSHVLENLPAPKPRYALRPRPSATAFTDILFPPSPLSSTRSRVLATRSLLVAVLPSRLWWPALCFDSLSRARRHPPTPRLVCFVDGRAPDPCPCRLRRVLSASNLYIKNERHWTSVSYGESGRGYQGSLDLPLLVPLSRRRSPTARRA